MEQIELMPSVAVVPQLEPAIPYGTQANVPSVPSVVVPVAPADCPWSVNDQVRHSNPAVTWEGTIVGTPATHPWDCCAGMVLVAMGERVERMAIALLRPVM